MTPPFQRPVLDRRVAFDERSRNHPIRPFLGARVLRKTTLHQIPYPLPLNQGAEGACVGFGWTGQMAVGPIFNKGSNTYARAYYMAARAVDRAAGRYWPEGASVLAGAHVARQRGLISGYKWAFGIDDVIDTLCVKGPVVLGVNWYESMYDTDLAGKVQINGAHVGGHCILATGFIQNHPQWGGDWIQWVNSWGPNYGVRGVGYISVADLKMLLGQDGEACIANEVLSRVEAPPVSWYQRIWDYLFNV